ncbi:recombinase RecB [Corynebacterium suranareeae]|uniref:Recombinase RecB n=2 Tax=Corynebacterium suranareeae TaxID=2506452 RepID=A0A161JPN6_9CORY|nr:recombinase RecB [Corynebacterium suranareeae]
MQSERITPSDLVGCRYRQVQRIRFPEIAPLPATMQRRARREVGLMEVLDRLPQQPKKRGRNNFTRVDLDNEAELAEFDTLEAIAAGETLITGAVFSGTLDGVPWEVIADILVRNPDGTYMPVMVSNHRVARPDPHKTMKGIAVSRLGVGQPLEVKATLRHHTIDGYRLTLAMMGLEEAGVAPVSSFGAVVGQDRDWAYLVDVTRYAPAAHRALLTPTPSAPRRVKECSTCRFWPKCEPELKAADDISLFLSGDRADTYREKGIHTTTALIEANLGEISHIAAAWRDDIPVLRRTEHTTAPRFDVEIDVDVEAYLDLGAYLWGAWDGKTYIPFVIWSDLGSEAEGENFAQFWSWLKARRDKARQQGQTFGVYCYASNGENHWMLSTARRFYGKVKGVPSEQEIRGFISSDQWNDMFAVARSQLVGPGGLGLKQLAPAAGFHWEEEDFAGEDSLHAYLIASTAPEPEAEAARAQLLSYNGDDCRATAAVRHWLRKGARSAPVLGA